MIIWFAANVPSGSVGGVARSMQGLAEGLHMLGHRTSVVTNGDSRGGYILFAFKLAARLFLNMTHQPDWIIARSTDGVVCALLIKALAFKTRLAIHNHGWEEYVYEIENRLPRRTVFPRTTWRARIIRFPLLRVCLALSAGCISGTLAEIRWLKKHYPRHQRKFHFVPNGVNAPDNGFWMEQHDAPLHLLAIGGLTWKKNILHTIDIFEELVRRLPECRFYLIGSCAPLDRISRHLHSGITVLPQVSQGEMPKWYRTCPFLLSSSRYEGGHSFALLEAMSHACVVFASAIPSSKEIIRNGENGMLISGIDAKTDAKVIAEVLRDKSAQIKMRRRALASARRSRWERQVHRMERVLCLNR